MRWLKIKKIITVALAIALVASVASTAMAASPTSPAGIYFEASTTETTIRHDNDTRFPEQVADLVSGLCFGTMNLMEIWEASSTVVRDSAYWAASPATAEIGLRVESPRDFRLDVTLSGFQMGSQNTLAGAFMTFTHDGATPIPATATGTTNVNGSPYQWRSMSIVPATVDLNIGVAPNQRLHSGEGIAHGDTVTIATSTGINGIDILWATNLVGELHMVPGSVNTPGVARATMTWTATPVNNGD